ncbi:MAG: ABC transporter substrate-binding protein [Alphaproteobacteria bacterium]
MAEGCIRGVRVVILVAAAIFFVFATSLAAIAANPPDATQAPEGNRAVTLAGEPAAGQDGVTDTTIRLGMSAAFSGSARALGIELYRGAMAYFRGINEAGGVYGRRIEIIAYDDRYEPELAVRNTLRLMNQDDVFALFDYVGTPTMNHVLPLLRKYQSKNYLLLFPFTGAETNRIPPYDRFSFNLRASYAQETGGLVDHFVAINRKKIAMFYQVDGYGRAGWAGVRSGLARHGLTLAGEATYRRGTPFGDSYDAQVAIMQEIDPDAIICIGTYAACAGFVRDARNRGVDVPVGTLSFVGSEAMLDLLSAAGKAADKDYTARLVSAEVVPSYNDDSIPAVREYKEQMTRHGDAIMPPEALIYPEGKDAQNEYVPLDESYTSFEGFLDAKLLVEILRRIGPDLKRTAIESAAMTIRYLDLGLGDPLSFGRPENSRQASDKVYFSIVADGRLVPFDEAGWKAWAKP